MISLCQDSRLYNKTLKRTRKFVVDGVEVSITTSKIISEDEKKDEEMRFLRQAREGVLRVLTGRAAVRGMGTAGLLGERVVRLQHEVMVKETKGNWFCLIFCTLQSVQTCVHPPDGGHSGDPDS